MAQPRNHTVRLDQIATRQPKDVIAEYDLSLKGRAILVPYEEDMAAGM
jgi:hypothetical protein